MSAAETLRREPEQSLVQYFTREYSYDAVWNVPPTIEMVEGQEVITPGDLSPMARLTPEGHIYLVDSLSKVLAGRNLNESKETFLKEKKCAAPVTNVDDDGGIKKGYCGKNSKLLILSNGRWQDATTISGACSDEHAAAFMGDEADFYYREEWDFMNAPVFGVYTPA